MNWAHFKDPVPHICLAGAVVATWSLKMLEGANPFTVMTNMDSVKIFRKNSIILRIFCGKLHENKKN